LIKIAMLGLKLPTDPRWVDIAEKNIEEILVDHAYCEQKAASSCISLIIHFPDKEALVDALTPVVAEEWEHFERVLAQLKKGGHRDQQLVEKLLINALIEARSCERFKLLWKNLEDEELKQFYYELMVSEAGHYTNFINLAKLYMPEELVNKRWQEYLEIEA